MSTKNDRSEAATLSRRDAARLLGLGGLAAWLGGSATLRGREPGMMPAATTEPADLQGAGFYKLKVGDATAYVVSDGTFPIRPADLYPEQPKADVAEAAARVHLSAEGFVAHVNVLLVREAGGKLTLIDTGAGGAFGPGAGHLTRNLARLGVTPGDVDVVTFTHLHPDHVGGLVDASGKLAFPKARVVVNRAEHDFWTGDHPTMASKLLPAEAQAQMVATAKAAMAAALPVLDLVDPGERGDVVTMIDTAGHTPGHVAVRVGHGAEAVTFVGDALIAPPLSAQHPDWHVFFDADPIRAAATRAKLLKDFAERGQLVSAAHASFPAVGYIERDAEAYRWSPKNWEW